MITRTVRAYAACAFIVAVVAPLCVSARAGCADPERAPQPSTAITIHTDKLRYDSSAVILITVKNETDRMIWYQDAEMVGRNPWWGLERLERGRWVAVALWKPDARECVLVVGERPARESLIRSLEPGAIRTDQWTQETCVTVSEVGPRIELRTVAPGTYRLVFTYGTDPSLGAQHVVYSSNFTLRGTP